MKVSSLRRCSKKNCIPTGPVAKILSLKLTFKYGGLSLVGLVVRVSPWGRLVLIGGERETVAFRQEVAVRGFFSRALVVCPACRRCESRRCATDQCPHRRRSSADRCHVRHAGPLWSDAT